MWFVLRTNSNHIGKGCSFPRNNLPPRRQMMLFVVVHYFRPISNLSSAGISRTIHVPYPELVENNLSKLLISDIVAGKGCSLKTSHFWFRMTYFLWRIFDFFNCFYNKRQFSPQRNKVLICFTLRPSKSFFFLGGGSLNYFG